MRRGFLFAIIGATVMMLAAGCGSPTASQASKSTQSTSVASTSRRSGPTNSPHSGYTYIGTIAEQLQGGGSESVAYSIGTPVTLGDSQEAQSIVSNCGGTGIGNDPSAYLNDVVAVPGRAKVTYTGTIPMTLDIWPGDTYGYYPSASMPEMVGNGNGQWSCNNNTGGFQYDNLAPGRGFTVDIWVFLAGVITNDAPTFNPAQYPLFGFSGVTIAGPDPGGSTLSATGPHAWVCPGGSTACSPYISLFGPGGTISS